jgi:transcriptional regulator with XRE-family HTH domain
VAPGDDNVTLLGSTIRRLRDERGWTQGELAYHAGVDQSHVSRIESGATKDTKVSTIIAIARALGVTIDELTGRSPLRAHPGADEDPVFRELDRDKRVKPETRRIVRMIVEADYRAWQEEQARKKGES